MSNDKNTVYISPHTSKLLFKLWWSIFYHLNVIIRCYQIFIMITIDIVIL